MSFKIWHAKFLATCLPVHNNTRQFFLKTIKIGCWNAQHLAQCNNGFEVRRMHPALILVHSRRRDKAIHPGKDAELLLRQATHYAGLFQARWEGRTVSIIHSVRYWPLKTKIFLALIAARY